MEKFKEFTERRRLLAEWKSDYLNNRREDGEIDDDVEDHIFRRAFRLGQASGLGLGLLALEGAWSPLRDRLMELESESQ